MIMPGKIGLTAGFAVLVTCSSGRPALVAANVCSNATLKGSYGLVGAGTVIGVGPAALVGILRYDGRGNVTGISIQKVNGNNVTLTLAGAYSVGADCIANDTVTVSNGQTANPHHRDRRPRQGTLHFEHDPPNASSGNVLSTIAKKQFSEEWLQTGMFGLPHRAIVAA